MKLSLTQSQPAHRLVLMQVSKKRNGEMDWKSEEKICNDENKIIYDNFEREKNIFVHILM